MKPTPFSPTSKPGSKVITQQPWFEIDRNSLREFYQAAVHARSLQHSMDHNEVDATIRKALKRKDRPGILKIAKEVGVGTSTVQRIAAEMIK